MAKKIIKTPITPEVPTAPAAKTPKTPKAPKSAVDKVVVETDGRPSIIPAGMAWRAAHDRKLRNGEVKHFEGKLIKSRTPKA